jgi:hypothetical protein
MASKRGKGRPENARAGDLESIVNKATWEFDKWDAKIANELPKLLDAYYKLAFTAEKENTRKSVLEELIKRAEKTIEGVEVSTKDLPTDEDEDDEELISLEPNISLLHANSK